MVGRWRDKTVAAQAAELRDDRTHESKTLSWNRADELLVGTTVTDRLARGVNAAGQRRLCDNSPLPDPIDQMKFFELIQIVPSPTLSALRSGDLVNYRISGPTNMGYLRNNSIFAFGQSDRARTSASYREILDAMWLFNAKFEKALAKFDEIKVR